MKCSRCGKKPTPDNPVRGVKGVGICVKCDKPKPAPKHTEESRTYLGTWGKREST